MTSRGHARRVRLACLLALLAAGAGAQARGLAELAPGELLVARAVVPDGRFRHAVVLILDVSAKGAAGVVINEPGAKTVAQVFPAIASAEGRGEAAYVGGPVDPATIFCLLQLEGRRREARRVLPGVYATTSLPLMELALNAGTPAAHLRVILGYAGWTAGQLQREVAAGLWTVVPGTAALVFDPNPATLWERLQAAPAKGR